MFRLFHLKLCQGVVSAQLCLSLVALLVTLLKMYLVRHYYQKELDGFSHFESVL